MTMNAPVRCKHCGGICDWSPTRRKELSRARHFTVFAAVLALAGAVLQLFGLAIWPWWLYGTAVFVVSQALLKVLNACWLVCRQCHGGQRGFRA
ncbi:hypothetical protein [Chitinolyticbacter albus]|uniref:hypothetical protein n=1 Tax=Chitinolyticbacter albus TaxID=2961951 RepID=UPI00210B9B25|nr:hypothetical protein [Chitinolyticbacter albus]